jgi:hypothetical protein
MRRAFVVHSSVAHSADLREQVIPQLRLHAARFDGDVLNVGASDDYLTVSVRFVAESREDAERRLHELLLAAGIPAAASVSSVDEEDAADD